jgi:lipopolysaccharide biosynthesis glycosyltransferase
VNIVIACNESFIPHAATMLCSLLENNTSSIRIFLLHDGIRQKKIKKLEQFIRKYGAEFEAFDVCEVIFSYLNVNNLYKSANYFRLLIPEILPRDICKVLYLDCDILVRKSIEDLWNIDLRDQLLAAVEDIEMSKNHKTHLGLPANFNYFNSGVLLINMDQWRKQSVHIKAINFIKSNPDKIVYFDQDGLNVVVKENWRKLPLTWNLHVGLLINPGDRIRFRDIFTDATIIHFTGTGEKPWQENGFHYPYVSEYNYYRRKTPWSKYKPENISRPSITNAINGMGKSILHFLGNTALFSRFDRYLLKMVEVIYSAKGKKLFIRIPQIELIDLEYIKSVFPDQTIISGSFKGLKYPTIESIHRIAPKLLGTYEIELEKIIEEICNKSYSTIINIGCGEGYYAVGFAMRIAKSRIYAYDIDPKARELCQFVATTNGVIERIMVDEIFTMRTLSKIPLYGQGLIVCNCGGAEEHIFYEDGENWMKLIGHYDLLIEIHDMNSARISKYIYDLFSTSHNIQIIYGVNDSLRPIMFASPLANEKDPTKIEELMSERRPGIMEWFYMKRKNPQMTKKIVPRLREER